MIINFYKMHGLGNDFIIIDNTSNKINLTTEQIKLLCNRRLGVGCDQLILTEEIIPHKQVKMTIFNSDGSQAGACGNATRCLGLHAMNKYQTSHIDIKTDNRLISVKQGENNNIISNMGKATFEWNDIPLSSKDLDPLNINIAELNLTGVAVNVGNPHIVFVVKNVDEVNLQDLGPKIETHPFFPEKTNVEFISILDKNTIRMRVWERGAGITLACGTGSMASFVVANKLNLIDKADSSSNSKTKVLLDGGMLSIYYNDKNDIIVEGHSCLVFEGKIEI